jgi:hypothetical protein
LSAAIKNEGRNCRAGANRERRKEENLMKSTHQIILFFIAWFAPILALPLFLFAFIGAGLSVASPHFPISFLILLALAPTIAVLIPSLLSIAELTFAFLCWKAR